MTSRPGGHPVAVLSYGYWTRRFGGSTAILNQTIRINGLSMTVVGVTPRNFLSLIGGQSPDVYVPVAMRALLNAGVDDLTKRNSHWLNIFGRLKPGISRAQAQAALRPIHPAFWNRNLRPANARRHRCGRCAMNDLETNVRPERRGSRRSSRSSICS